MGSCCSDVLPVPFFIGCINGQPVQPKRQHRQKIRLAVFLHIITSGYMQKHEPLFRLLHISPQKHVQKASEISIVFAVIQEKLSDFNDFFDMSHADSMDYRAMINLKGQF